MIKKKFVITAILFGSTLYGEWNGALEKIIDGNLSKAKEKISTVLKHTEETPKSPKELYSGEIKSIWEDVINKLQEGVKLEKERDKLPDHAIFSKDKGSVDNDINEVFDDILEIILDGELFQYRKNLTTLKERIDTLQKKITMYREKKIVAPQTSIIATTKSGYEKKIKDAQAEIKSAKQGIEEIKNRLSKNLKYVGINLTPSQIDVLLSRVDGDDTLQVTMVIQVLKEITNQLAEIMQESSKNLKYAKKYYGMHMVVVKMVAWVQHQLIEKYNRVYIPHIDKIIDTTLSIAEKTKSEIAKEKDPKRVALYRQNLKTQEYTYKIAKRYKADLLEKLNRLKKSYQITLRDVSLAENTYKTVSLSDELFKLITDSKKMLDSVMKLQIPSIIPFDSEIVKKKYQEITEQIKAEGS